MILTMFLSLVVCGAVSLMMMSGMTKMEAAKMMLGRSTILRGVK